MGVRKLGIRERRQWTEQHIRVLLSGRDFFRAFASNGPCGIMTREREDYTEATDVDARRQQAWQDLAPELLVDWIRTRPFTRPWAWWRYDPPECRRCMSGEHPYDAADWGTFPKRYSFGLPTIKRRPEDWEATFETERDFLERLGLLTPEELALMPIEL